MWLLIGITLVSCFKKKSFIFTKELEKKKFQIFTCKNCNHGPHRFFRE